MADIILDLGDFKVVKALRQLENYEKKLHQALQDGIEEVALQLRYRLIEEMISFGLGGSGLIEGIRVTPTLNGISISVTSPDGEDYATFVEFGTGIVGAGDPHPNAGIEGWQYDTKGHGHSGWMYPSHSDDPNPTKHLNSKGEWIAWTAGHESRPFMYNTWLYGTQMATNVINKHIGRIKI